MNQPSNRKRKPSSKHLWWLSGVLMVLLVAGFIVWVGKIKAQKRVLTPDPAFAAYVSGYTGGMISSNHPILIRLSVAPLHPVKAGDPFPQGLLSFSPSVQGKAFWKDERTIVFQPDENLRSGQVYQAHLQLNKVVKVSEAKFNRFSFGFKTIPQSFEVVPEGLVTDENAGMEAYTFKGKIVTADIADGSAVEKMLYAEYQGKDKTVSWQHPSPTEHVFLIKGIKRFDKEQQLKLSWKGKPIHVDQSGTQDIAIPRKGLFQLIQATVTQGDKPEIHLRFSNPLDKQQSVSGMVQVDSQKDFGLVFVVRQNELTIFPEAVEAGSKDIAVFQGIKDMEGHAIKRDTTFQLLFESPKPAIRFVHRGNLLPSTEGMVLPFEAIGLKSVLVRVMKIDQDRIGQFLQVNDLDGSSQLNRVGRPILQKVIRLNNMGVNHPNQWNRFTLELSQLIQPDPGAVYQVALTFTPEDIIQDCGLSEGNSGLTPVAENPREKMDTDPFDNGSSYYYDDFGQYYSGNYDWSKRQDPCNDAYYSGTNNVIKQNILATDIGLTAKRGSDNKLWVLATNLKTTDPMSRVAIHVYNYQLQEIATTGTNRDGIAQVALDQKPFLIEATYQDQWSYLKIDDGNALSVSQFQVAGQSIQQGLKGFLYGDRGVWRPGDSLYLSFMLEDKMERLPDNHPVIFELSDPKGTVIDHIVQSSSVKGLYTFRTATSPDAPTGNWTATVKVGDASFVKNIPIETVKPNRLKLELSFPNDRLTPEHQSGDLHVRWLSGATASNLKAKYDMLLSAAPTHIKGFKDYRFDDPLNHFETEERTVFEGRLDAQGNATINPAIHLSQDAPATLKAYFTGKVFEPGGNFSVNYQAVNYYPYTAYVGIKVPEGSGYGNMLDLDKTYQVKVVSVDAQGKPLSRSGLAVSVYKTQWRWWWEADDHDDADYVQSQYYHKVFETTIDTRNGKGVFPLKIAAPDWGRYYIRVKDKATGYTTGSFVYFEWPYNSGSQVAGMPGGATRLNFTTDKQTYQIGDKMQLFIPGSGSGHILISVENGTGVLKTYWIKEKKGTNTFSIPVTEEMTPNVYLNVAAIQPHEQTVNDLPIRQYGIIGVKVEDPATVLHPVIEMPQELSPNKKVSIRVKEQNGKAMSYTIAVVDEGLLDLTNFQTPAPHDLFYAREALGVKTWDVFDRVIGAYGGRLERLLSIGGDGTIEEKPETHNLRFKPVVKFFGPFFLEKGKTQSVSFTMPNYVGAVRTMVVAGYQGAYGSAEKSVQVKQPLMILPTLPRVAGPGEDILLPVNVFAMKPGIKDVSVRITGDQYFRVVGEATKQIHFDQPGNGLVTFKIHVAEKEGAGKIKASASGNGFTATSETDLTVRNPNAPQVKVLSKALKPGEQWTPEVSFFGIKGTNSAILEIAGIPPLNLGERLNYLIEYPFGCMEQRVSGAFPQLYLNDLMQLSEAKKNTISQNISSVIKAAPEFQHSSGGFSYWPGSNYPDDWVSSYTGNFLLEAKKKGYQVMPGILDKWVAYQTQRANAWKPGKYHRDELVQAYRLYTLALAKQPDWSAMNRMHGLQDLSLQARWSLAAAYNTAGRQDVAEELIRNVSTTVPDYREMSYTYGSSLRDEAMILSTLTQMGQAEQGYTLAKHIAESLNSDRWLSTQETSFSLMALAEFYSRQKGATSVKYSYRQNGQTPVSVQSGQLISQKALQLKETQPQLSVRNNADGILYANVVIKGTPAAGKELSESNHLGMSVKYLNMKGQAVNPDNLSQGTDFMVEITVSNPGLQGDYKNMALTTIFPSGWEIRNTRFEGTGSYFEASTPTYQDIRDDRVYTHFDLPAGKQKTFRILLNAAYAGHFYMPGIKCSAMYDATIHANKQGKWVNVKPE